MLQFPDLFEERTREILGDEFELLKHALNEPTPVSIRLNSRMTDYQPSDKCVPWSSKGFYLGSRPLFTADPLFHAGAYYVQEASSMFVEELVRQLAPHSLQALDLCAAPGGKSTLLSEILPAQALLVSNEIVRSRSQILAENLIKWGNPSIVVSNNAPGDFQKLPSFFDLMVVDAPCSGEGMFRKDPAAISEWSIANVRNCAIRQKQVLTDAWDSLQTGGVLIYSTCTYNREENEETVRFVCDELGAELLPADISRFQGIVDSGYGYRFYPHRIKGEGFFVAALRKTAPAPFSNRPKADLRKNKLKESIYMKSNLISADNFSIFDDGEHLFALPAHLVNEMLHLRDKLNCLVNGVQLATRKGKDLIPAHQLALSKILNKETVSTCEVDYTNAINYLRKEAIFLSDSPAGYILICYNNQALGWVKNLGNRSNNLYPQHWRIRMNL